MKVCPACNTQFGGETWDCPSCGYVPPRAQGFSVLMPRGSAPGASDAGRTLDIAALESAHPWFHSRALLIAWAVQRFCGEMDSFLDVGCGTGLILQHLSRRFPYAALAGGDPSPAALHCAMRRVPDASLYQLDALSLPFDAEYDAVGAFDVLEHIPDDLSALVQMRRATRCAGTLFLTVPQHPFLWSPFDDYSGHVRRYTRRVLVETVRKAGWEVVYTTSFVTLLLPMIAVSRTVLAEPFRRDPLRELRVQPALGQLARAVMFVERTLIQSGVRPIFGSSLLLVAKRSESLDARDQVQPCNACGKRAGVCPTGASGGAHRG